jgi:hypothetical protein
MKTADSSVLVTAERLSISAHLKREADAGGRKCGERADEQSRGDDQQQ